MNLQIPLDPVQYALESDLCEAHRRTGDMYIRNDRERNRCRGDLIEGKPRGRFIGLSVLINPSREYKR